MATILDGFGLLQKFQIIFPFLFILVISYAIFAKTGFPSKNTAVQGFLALILAVLFLFSEGARTVVNLMAPWFVVLFVFLIFVLLAFMLFGHTEEGIVEFMKTSTYGSTIAYWIITLVLIIGLGSLANVGFGGKSSGVTPENVGQIAEGQNAASAGESAFWGTLFHPQVLGMVFILLVAMFTLQKLARYD